MAPRIQMENQMLVSFPKIELPKQATRISSLLIMALWAFACPTLSMSDEPSSTIQITVLSADTKPIGADIEIDIMYGDQSSEKMTISPDQLTSLTLKNCTYQVKLKIKAMTRITHLPRTVRCVPNPLNVILLPTQFANLIKIDNYKLDAPSIIADAGEDPRSILLQGARLVNADYPSLIAQAYESADVVALGYVASEAAWASQQAGSDVAAAAYRSLAIEAGVSAIAERTQKGQMISSSDLLDIEPSSGMVVMSYEGKSLVQGFQKSVGLEPTGVIGPKTMDAMALQF